MFISLIGMYIDGIPAGGTGCDQSLDISHKIWIVYDFISKLPEWAKASFNIHVEVK